MISGQDPEPVRTCAGVPLVVDGPHQAEQEKDILDHQLVPAPEAKHGPGIRVKLGQHSC